MGGEKIVLVREAIRQALAMLRPEDRFSLVVYDDRIDVIVGSTPSSAEARRNAERQLAGIDARGSTDLSGGWLTGCEQVAMHLDANSAGRCLVLTDGLANRGITDHDELKRHAEELRKRQIVTSTFGVGSDFDENLLQKMAAAGGGNSYYIERNVQILDYLTSELGEALEVVARDTAIEVVLPAGVKAAPLNEYAHTRVGNSMRVNLGEIVSGQEISIVLRLDFPEGKESEQLSAEFCLSDRDRVFDSPPVSVVWRFADHQSNDKQPRDREVDRAVAELYAARARDEALALNRAGNFHEARAILLRTAHKIEEYAADDSALRSLAAALVQEEHEFSAPMAALEMKSRYYASMNVMRNRDAEGKAKRKS
jgi:Ca-activated chloride channel family protein